MKQVMLLTLLVAFATISFLVKKKNSSAKNLFAVGVGAGAFANFNSIQSPVGGYLKIMIGWMNTKKKTL